MTKVEAANQDLGFDTPRRMVNRDTWNSIKALQPHVEAVVPVNPSIPPTQGANESGTSG